MPDATQAKESKAQKAERLKREKNPWNAFDEVRAFAREGRSSVVPDWASTYFKWWGIYTQGDGVGATGGKGGEGPCLRLFHDAYRHSQRHCFRRPTSRHRRAYPQICPQPGRYHGTPKHPASLAHRRVTSRGCGCARRRRAFTQRCMRRRGAQRDRLPACRSRGR